MTEREALEYAQEVICDEFCGGGGPYHAETCRKLLEIVNPEKLKRDTEVWRRKMGLDK